MRTGKVVEVGNKHDEPHLKDARKGVVKELDSPLPKVEVIEVPDEVAPKKTWLRWIAAGITTIVGLEVIRATSFAFSVAPILGWATTAVFAGVGVVLTYKTLSWYRAGKQLEQRSRLKSAAIDAYAARSTRVRDEWVNDARQTLTDKQTRAFIDDIVTKRPHTDSRELITHVDSYYRAEKDPTAQALIANRAKRAALGIGASPFATLDMAIMVWQSVKLCDELCKVYGITPNNRVRYRLVSQILKNTFFSGASELVLSEVLPEMGVSLAGQLVGRAGQGFAAAVVVSRFGISANKVLRPVPYLTEEPKLKSSLAKIIFNSGASELTQMGVKLINEQKTSAPGDR